jgi:hypothetical protein
MSAIAELERLAMDLPEGDRALLAARLPRPLPPVPHDQHDGMAEALRRDAELDLDPNAGMSLEEFDEEIQRHRKRR